MNGFKRKKLNFSAFINEQDYELMSTILAKPQFMVIPAHQSPCDNLEIFFSNLI